MVFQKKNYLSFPSYIQHDQMDCGPACIKIIARHYGKTFSMKDLRDRCYITREGVSLFDISRAAESVNFRTLAIKVTFEDLKDKMPLPVIVHWKMSHFVVVYKVNSKKVFVSDPARGLITYSHDAFRDAWEVVDQKGAILILEPKPDFDSLEDTETPHSLWHFLRYLKPHYKYLTQVFVGMIGAILMGLLTPFIRQATVDYGIGGGNMDFIEMMMIAGLILAVSSTASSFIQGRLMLYVSERINMGMVSDFLTKTMSLPVFFFERKMITDIMTRIGDHGRIQSFIMNTFLGIALNILLIIIYGSLMWYYEPNMFTVFMICTAVYTGWIFLFLKPRKKLDNQLFELRGKNSNDLLELLEGVNEIKVNNISDKRRWKWELSRFRIYGLRVKNMNLNQLEKSGSLFISQVQGILLTYISASNVIDGTMSLGMMMSTQYILGQLAGPISGMIGYAHSMQFAKLSLKRVNEILLEEEPETQGSTMDVPDDKTITLKNVGFHYNPNLKNVLEGINIVIPEGKITAVVGESGSGKTTLVKILLRFYEPTEGEIEIGGQALEQVNLYKWRNRCGTVLQDGRLFRDTILYNITLEDEEADVDKNRLKRAIEVANVQEFIEERPLKLYTPMGDQGTGVSQGQKQRILLARALYKDPDFIFLDEATNSLDANNEKKITANLEKIIAGKTALIVAHRLSTVRKAHNIIVLDKGKVVEQGTHLELIEARGYYYRLVANQLEI